MLFTGSLRDRAYYFCTTKWRNIVSMKKFFPLIFIISGFLLFQNKLQLHLLFVPIDVANMTKDDVSLYSAPWCGYCAKTRRFFRAADIPFTEYDIESSTAYYEEFENLGGRGVPLVKVGSILIEGYEPGLIRSAIEKLSSDVGVLNDRSTHDWNIEI